MSERILQIAHHLEIPKEFIMEINERPDESTVVLLNNYQKFTITHAQLTYAQQQLDAQDETNDEPNNPTAVPTPTPLAQGLIVGLGRVSIDRLNEIGITTLQQFATANTAQLAQTLHTNQTAVSKWQQAASDLLP